MQVAAPFEHGRRMVVARIVLGRLAVFFATLAGAVVLVLGLLWAAPGNPVDLVSDDPAVQAALTAEWHLDQPVPKRLAGYLGRAMTGDLGTSLTYRPGMAVTDVIIGPTIRSLSWLLGALLLTMVWGTTMAWQTAGRPSWRRKIVQLISIAPVFLLAHIVVHTLNEGAFYAINAGWIGPPSWFALPDQPSMLRTVLAILILALGSGALAEVRGEVENTLVDIRSSGYVRAATARGGPSWPHVLLNLVPVLTTVASSRAAFFVGGLVILEMVLLLNGIGAVLWQAALMRDYPLALGITVVLAGLVCAARLIGDTIRLAVDPRLRTEWTG